MKRHFAHDQHPIARTALAAALAAPFALAPAALAPQPAQALNFEKTLAAGETYEHTAVSRVWDVYKIGVHKKGYVRLKIDVPEDNRSLTGISYSIVINDVEQKSGVISSDDDLTTAAIPVGPDQDIEFRATAFGFCSEISYKLRLIAFTPDNLETEPNDTRKEADGLLLGKPRYGLAEANSQDFFRFKADRDGVYSIQMKLSEDTEASASIRPSLAVGEETPKELEAFQAKKLTRVCSLSLKRGQTAFISLTNPSYSLGDQSFYRIQLACKDIPTPQLKALAGKRKAAKVTWSKTSKHADDYQIRWSQGKSMKDAKTRLVSGVSKTSATLKGLKPKKRYYVQVRAFYVDYDRETGWNKQYHFFTWSKAKSAKTK